MRIAHVFPVLENGGTERVILQLSSYIKSRMDTATVAILTQGGSRKSDFEMDGIQIFEIPKFINKISILNNLNAIRTQLMVFKPDIIHTHSLYSLFLVGIIKQILPFPVVVVHTGHGGPRKNYDSIAKWLVFMADKYVALTPKASQLLSGRRSRGDCITYIRNGVNTPPATEIIAMQKRHSASELRLGFVGRLTEQKGLSTLIDACAILLGHGIRVQATVVGDGDLRKILEQHAERMGLLSSIKFIGYHAAAWDILQDCHVIVMPSLWEQSPLVAMEALVRHHTLVATSISGIKEVVKDGLSGYLFSPGDHVQLSAILLDIAVGKKPLVNPLNLDTKEYLFDQSTGPGYLQLYSSLLKRHSRATLTDVSSVTSKVGSE